MAKLIFPKKFSANRIVMKLCLFAPKPIVAEPDFKPGSATTT